MLRNLTRKMPNLFSKSIQPTTLRSFSSSRQIDSSSNSAQSVADINNNIDNLTFTIRRLENQMINLNEKYNELTKIVNSITPALSSSPNTLFNTATTTNSKQCDSSKLNEELHSRLMQGKYSRTR